eukprot:SAG11_NODE_4323_length_1948_cov_4.689562_1_plen_137_part_00
MTCRGWALMRLKRYGEAEQSLRAAGLPIALGDATRQGDLARRLGSGGGIGAKSGAGMEFFGGHSGEEFTATLPRHATPEGRSTAQLVAGGGRPSPATSARAQPIPTVGAPAIGAKTGQRKIGSLSWGALEHEPFIV